LCRPGPGRVERLLTDDAREVILDDLAFRALVTPARLQLAQGATVGKQFGNISLRPATRLAEGGHLLLLQLLEDGLVAVARGRQLKDAPDRGRGAGDEDELAGLHLNPEG